MIPREVLQAMYSILIKSPGEGRDPNSPPTAEELLNAHGYMRGFMTQRGLPDNSRSARYILKDFVNGKLLYCHAPPGVNQNEFHTFPEVKSKSVYKLVAAGEGAGDDVKAFLSESDKYFFGKNQMHIKGKGLPELPTDSTEKPWKKHCNKNKREKLRRVYKHLDSHQ
ncbi:hypothetical protein JTE90_024661 [Oedothorax gibbosus]|uniref:Uncharacterized protein n=1 Tax=Oedothorax gibbosus TaxID=931172 RepID=A0AAV6U3Y3_9ARAC|nr:hypothetical protein JTE90_024661 [Oedothorax gibbosus]